MLVAMVWLVSTALGQAKQTSVQVVGQIGKANVDGVFVLDQATMEAHATSYVSEDPNFSKDGRKEFRGVTIETLLELTQAEPIDGVTFIANDAYVTYEPLDQILRDKVMLAFEADGQRIKKNRGGPYMIMREPVGDTLLYTWYIDTIILGTSLRPTLTVQQNGRTSVLTKSEMEALPVTLLQGVPPQPRGYRMAEPLNNEMQIEAVRLSDLLKGTSAFKEVTLVPYVGKAVTLSAAEAQLPIHVLRSFDGQHILSAHGGPYSVLFPKIQHPELLTPDALFFLQRIELR